MWGSITKGLKHLNTVLMSKTSVKVSTCYWVQEPWGHWGIKECSCPFHVSLLPPLAPAWPVPSCSSPWWRPLSRQRHRSAGAGHPLLSLHPPLSGEAPFLPPPPSETPSLPPPPLETPLPGEATFCKIWQLGDSNTLIHNWGSYHLGILFLCLKKSYLDIK